MNGKDIVSGVISALFLSCPASARANEGLALSPPASALPTIPSPSLLLGGGKVTLKPWKMKRGVGMVFKTQSPESAFPKELLRLGLAAKDGGLAEDEEGGYIVAVGPDS